MDRNGFAALILLVLIASDVSHAFSLTKLRRLIRTEAAPNPISSEQVSPVSSPASNISGPRSTGADTSDSGKASESPVAVPSNPSGVEPKSPNYTVTGSPPVSEQTGDGKEAQAGIAEVCEQSLDKCVDKGNMIACVPSLGSGSGSGESLLVQNQGESSLKVNLSVLTPSKKLQYNVEIPKHQSRRVNISETIGESFKVVLNSGNGTCFLQVSPLVSKGSYFLRLPSYTQLLTPINGAYVMLVTVLIFGATWAGCKYFKRGQHGEIPYQELEMGLPESVSASNLETVDGWDQGWDDDWDDSGKLPGTGHLSNISSNGLASRASNRDGWEKDWND